MRRGEVLITTVSLASIRLWKLTMSSMEYTGCEMFWVVTIIVLACFIGKS